MAKYTIVFKSGAKVKFTAESLRATWHQYEGTFTSIEWKGAKPNPLGIVPSDITAIFEGEA